MRLAGFTAGGQTHNKLAHRQSVGKYKPAKIFRLAVSTWVLACRAHSLMSAISEFINRLLVINGRNAHQRASIISHRSWRARGAKENRGVKRVHGAGAGDTGSPLG